MEKVKKEIKQAKITVSSVFVGEMSLEDVFICLITQKETSKTDKLEVDIEKNREYDGVTSNMAEPQRIGE